MGVLSGNPKDEPMHYGEVFAVWSYLLASKGALMRYQVFMNHTGDEDLRRLLEDLIHNMVRPEIEQTEQLLKENGVALPPGPPERPGAPLESIPAGARINDPETSAILVADLSAGLVACSQIMGQCIREDIAMMFGQFHQKKAQYGSQLLRLNKEKGWLVVPPLQVKASEPALV